MQGQHRKDILLTPLNPLKCDNIAVRTLPSPTSADKRSLATDYLYTTATSAGRAGVIGVTGDSRPRIGSHDRRLPERPPPPLRGPGRSFFPTFWPLSLFQSTAMLICGGKGPRGAAFLRHALRLSASETDARDTEPRHAPSPVRLSHNIETQRNCGTLSARAGRERPQTGADLGVRVVQEPTVPVAVPAKALGTSRKMSS
ncbi:hypothetical protein SKAU_G00028060 [Synaphobranchus kaupii]|uniref:Uncharacterized protein n=1 Tax=Synaphobranchus kaupii TaxID=118154 RepID=A0A9Q1GE46_SYNKA|nr:hypothetical protein SKAU_G00028060 [Synaphobranchus kaupii]